MNLTKIRDLIYSYAWSRDRRDEQKFDFVVSQWGVNRNVPERFIPDTPYGISAFQHPEKLRCDLHLVNKEISADFRRFIYSVNDLEIDIDLKPERTKQAENELQKIVTLLQNPNFQEYTQTVRVRIHFPSRYPKKDLPVVNQETLDKVAHALDSFRQLQYLTIRVVPSQDKCFDYELRLAAFPFYLMHMTRWSLRILNLGTLKWDLIEGQRVQELDKAWELYQKTGNLSAATNGSSTVKITLPKDKASASTKATALSNLNGSQKRKHRKRKANVTALDKTISSEDGIKFLSERAQATAEPDLQLPDIQPLSAPPSAAPASNMLSHAEDADPVGNNIHTSTNVPIIKPENMHASPPSPPISPSKPRSFQQINMTSTSSDTSTGEVVLTPSESLTDDNAVVNSGSDLSSRSLNKTVDSQQGSEASRPPSPPLNPDAFGANSEAYGLPRNDSTLAKPDQVDDTFVAQRSENSSTQRCRKAKRRSKKPKHSKTASPPQTHQNPDSEVALSIEMDDQKLPFPSEMTTNTGNLTIATTESSNVALVEDQNQPRPVTTIITFGDYPLYLGNSDQENDANLRCELQKLRWQARGRQQIDMRRRQIERLAEGARLKEAQKKEARKKRALKKAKALHLRRDNIATDSPLSRTMEYRPKSKPKDPDRRVVTPKSVTSIVSNTLGNTDMRFAERLGYGGPSTIRNDVSQTEDHSFGFGFDAAIDRKVEEVEEDELDEIPDKATSSALKSSGRHLHHTHPVEDDNAMNTFNSSRNSACRSLLDKDAEVARSQRRYSTHVRDIGILKVENPTQNLEFSMELVDLEDPQPDFVVNGSPISDQSTRNCGAEERHHDPQQSGKSGSKRCGQYATENSERDIMPPPGFSCRQKSAPQRADVAGTRRVGDDQTLTRIEAQERKNKWIEGVQTRDDEVYSQRKEHQAKLKEKMKADGTHYSDHDVPIHDKWTKTDGTGNCLEKSGENIIYDQ